jgi:hypothetical protein
MGNQPVYPGARYFSDAEALFTSSDADTYFSILLRYHDKIVLEVGAHDHVADLRYHNSELPSAALKEVSLEASDKFYFHNLLICPGTTSVDS